MAYWGAIAQGAMDIGSAWLSSDDNRRANQTNVQIARENREWSESMSNSAIRRRAADIEAAGGNRALAFVNGSEATTPTVTPARVEPMKYSSGNIGNAINSAKLLQAQIDQVKATTYNTSADTRNKTLQGDIIEGYGGANSALDVQRKTNENIAFEQELRKKTADADISEQTARLIKDKSEEMLKLIRSQATLGELNAESAKSISNMLGVTGKDAGFVSKLILELAKYILSGGK